MTDKPQLHIICTMNCEPIPNRMVREGPRTWEVSARAIEGFCTRLVNAGFPPTLFLAPDCIDQHTPMLEEAGSRGVELGLFVHPPNIGEGQFKRCLGTYNIEEQRAIIDYSAEWFADALGVRPRSFRSGRASASDTTYKVLYELGFRQGSISEPGSRRPLIGADWEDAQAQAHYVDPTNRLRSGSLQFLEVPLTTDPTQLMAGGLPFELVIESGPFETHHRLVIEQHLRRLADEDAPFRTLCIGTHNTIDYYRGDERNIRTLDELLTYLETLAESYDLVPCTLAGAHENHRRISKVIG